MPFVGVYDAGNWHLDGQAAQIAFGLPGDQPVMGDWNGDGKKTPGVFRNGMWVLDETGNGFDGGDRVLYFGLPGDKAIAGDWDGDGKDTVGVFRNGNFTFDKNGNGFDAADTDVISFGWATDIPVAGDWNGDGKDTVGVFRDGTWVLDLNGNGYDANDRVLQFGLPGDQPVVGDWNGNSKDTPGVLQKGQWFFDREGNGYTGETGTPNKLGNGIAVSGSRPTVSPASSGSIGPISPNDTTASDHNKLLPIISKPLAGKDINLENKGLSFNPNGDAKKMASVLVGVSNPQRNSGTFSVRLYWASGLDLKSTFLKLAGERTINVDRYKGDIRVDFGRADMTARPDQASHLIAVVNGDQLVKETNAKDNVKGLELAPRTFVFRISGFASSSSSGLEKIDLDSLKSNSTSQVVVLPTIQPNWTAPGGARMFEDAKSSIDRSLKALNATSKDRVILIGHSYGGDIALRLASDVNHNLAGNQPAFALVLIDPVDFVLAQQTGKRDQFDEVRKLPSNINARNVLLISSNPTVRFLDGNVRGYRIAGVNPGPEIQRLWFGKNGVAGDKDDLTHTSVDDSPEVHKAILRFMSQQIIRKK